MKNLVIVLPKEDVSDPQGLAICNAAGDLGFCGLTSVRAGKSFLLEWAGEIDDSIVKELSDKLLANPIVESFTIQRIDD